jgi:hypothetical protein
MRAGGEERGGCAVNSFARTVSLGGAALLQVVGVAAALPIDTGSDVEINWNNTITFGAAAHTNGYVSGFVGDSYVFGAGTATAYDRGRFTPLRGDLLSELSVEKQGFGLEASALGRIEKIESPAGTASPYLGCSRDVGDEICSFPRGTVEPLNAFIHGTAALGGEQRLTLRIGRHSLFWGESLYFPENGIVAGMAPVDPSLVGTLGAYSAKSGYLPVGQISASWQATSALTLELYDQFEWRRSRIDIFEAHPADTPSSTDQYGAALHWHRQGFDYGLYALRYDAKTPVLHLEGGSGPAAAVSAYALAPAAYREQFPRGIEIYGVSLAGPLGNATFGAEFSARRNMPLLTGVITDSSGGSTTARAFPAGDSWHAQFSWTYVTPPLPGIPAGATWTGEIAANGLIATTAHPELLTLDRSRHAAAFRTVFEPQFLQVLPRLDLSLPVGFGYNFLGLSPLDPVMNRGTGDLSLGVTATFDRVWIAALTWTHYLGTAKNTFPYNFVPAGRPLDTADFIALAVQRSF